MTLEDFVKKSYSKSNDNYQRVMDIYNTQDDKLSALACDFENGSNAACANFAAAFAKPASDSGIPAGMIYEQTPGHEAGHMLGWRLNPDGTVAVSSNNKVTTRAYGSVQEMIDSVSSSRKTDGKAVYFTDQKGNYLVDKSQEEKWSSDVLAQTQKILGGGKSTKGGLHTEAEMDRYRSTIFKNLK